MTWNPRALAASPFFASVASLLDRLPADRFPTTTDLSALAGPEIVSGGGAPIRFVNPLPVDRLSASKFESNYEVRIHREGTVQTRDDSLHDLFNALAWLRFPRAKAALNRSHYRQMLARDDASGMRGAARDALTLFDESGVLVASSSPALLGMLRNFEWKALFVGRREELASSLRVYVFGHSVLEKAVSPYKGLTGKAMLFGVGREFFDLSADAQLRELDRRVADDLESLSDRPVFAPLPLLGMPGWCADNEDPAYYEDTAQFRPGRVVRRQKH